MDVGVDVGTTVTKAVAFDADGRPLAEASRPTRLVHRSTGRFEHETEEIVASVNEVVQELAGTVGNRPGVLARIAQLFAEHGVSIEIMRQTIHRDAESNVESAELRIVTHRASEAALAATVQAVKGLDVINSVTSVLRVEGV